MASQEADGAELRAARAGEAPGRPGEAAAGGRSADPRSQNHPEVLQVLGVSQAPLVHFFKREGDDHPMGTLFMSPWGFLSYSSLDRSCGLRRRGHILPLKRRHAEAQPPGGRHPVAAGERASPSCGPRQAGRPVGQAVLSRVSFTLCFSEGSL